MSDEFLRIEIVETGEVKTMPYRRAVSLLSRQLAVVAPPDTAVTDQDLSTDEDPQDPETELQDDQDDEDVIVEDAPPKRTRKKQDLSTPAREGQEGVYAENKPPNDE